MNYTVEIKNKIKDKNLKYIIFTMGCSLNENDSEKMSGMIEKMGFSKTNKLENADFVIFNTCCVRENAEEKLFGKIGEIKKIKEKRNIIIAIGGCMMQEKESLEKIKKSYKYVDIVFGTHTMQDLPKDVYEVICENKKIDDIAYIDGEIIEGLPIKRSDKYKAQVTIMYGCNNFCTYCIVPFVRGRERSRDPEDILKEIRGLAKEGYKEIMLLGQNVNSYGNDKFKYCKNEVKSDINTFAKLLREINKIEGIERIRFISPHPKDFSQDVIEAIRDCPKISRLIHLPLQSGNTKVLKEMNRNYTKEQYLELVEKMKKTMPDVKFSTDIIVGFPGETDEEFEDTIDVVNKVGYEQVFMFIYSVRRGTLAEKRKDQIPDEIKHKRFDKLKELCDSKIEEINDKYIGTIQKVLVEGFSKNNKDMLTGRTDSNKVVVFEPKQDVNEGNFVNIKITENHKWYLEGIILK